MITLKNITFFDFVLMGDDERSEYEFAIKFAKPFLKPVNEFELPALVDQSFEFIKERLQDNIERGNLTWEKTLEIIAEMKGTDMKHIVHEKLIKISRQKEWLFTEFEKLMKIEMLQLAIEGTPEQNEASEGLFDSLGILIQLDTLACGDVTKYNDVRKCKYSECLAKLILEARRSKCDQNYQKIIERKYKNKEV